MAMHRNTNDFIPVPWSDVCNGDTVYLRGSHDGEPAVYGPHCVVSADERKLGNSKGTFMHYSEALMFRKRAPVPLDTVNVGDTLEDVWGRKGKVKKIELNHRGFFFTMELLEQELKSTTIYGDGRPNRNNYRPAGSEILWPGGNVREIHGQTKDSP